MATLKKAKPDPEALWEVIESFSTSGNDTFKRGFKVRADHPAVVQHRALFMPADLDDVAKAAVRREYWAESYAQQAADQPGPAPDPIARPPSGRFRALRSWTLSDPDLAHIARVNAGQLVDASSEVYRRYPQLFVQDIEERQS